MAADTMPMMSDAGEVKSASFPTAMETAEETTVSDAGGNKSIEGQTTTMICVFVGDDKGGGEERGSNEEGDAVLAEEGWKEGSWAPSLSAFTALDSFMVRGRMLGGSNKGGDKEGNEVVDVARTLDNDSREEGDSNDNHHAQEQPCQRASSRVPFRTSVPQAKPLSLGEVLGSTLPWGGDEEGDDVGTNLGWGEEETTLTDGAMDPGGDVGADDGSTEDKDEIGLIFKLEGKETKVCLRHLGSYVKFSSNKCLHRGYKKGSVKTYLSAQLFSAPMGKRSSVQNNVAKFEEGTLNEYNLSVLKSIREAVQRGWKDKYMKKKFNAPKKFQLRKVNQDKTRKIDKVYFADPDLVEVQHLIDIFQAIYHNTIRVTEVWFLKKKDIGDGFEDFHYDYR